jgi:hypothetical protein
VVIERDRKDILTLGRRLADSAGFRVVALDGREIGVAENVRYENHTDHPDEIVVRRRFLLWDRFATIAFDDVANVDPERERVYLAVPSEAVTWER